MGGGQRCHDQPQQVLISVDGNIGCGKSTLLRAVQARLVQDELLRTVTVLQEPVKEWQEPQDVLQGRSMLQTVYEPCESGASVAPFQIFALMSRMRQLLGAMCSDARVVLSERCMTSDRAIFMTPQLARGMVRPEEWVAYHACYQPACEVLGPRLASPAVVIYVRCSPETCWRRVQGRRRPEETGVTLQYLREVHDLHEEWIATLRHERQAHVIILDGEADGDDASVQLADVVLDVLQRVACRYSLASLLAGLRGAA